MCASNLGVCCGPSLLWSPNPSVNQSRAIPTLTEMLIRHCEVLFGEGVTQLFGEERSDSGAEESTDSLHCEHFTLSYFFSLFFITLLSSYFKSKSKMELVYVRIVIVRYVNERVDNPLRNFFRCSRWAFSGQPGPDGTTTQGPYVSFSRLRPDLVRLSTLHPGVPCRLRGFRRECLVIQLRQVSHQGG